jgi:transglutaminase-like putative cysteine protease
MLSRLHFCRVLLLAAIAICAHAACGASEDFERWYVLRFDDQKVGWMHEAQQRVGEEIRTTTEMRFEIGRLGQNVELSMRYGVRETLDGELIEMRSVENMGTTGNARSIHRFDHQARTITSEVTQQGLVGARTRTRTRPFPEGSWLTPAEARRFVEKRIEAGAETIEYATLDPSIGAEPVKVVYRLLGPATVEAEGRRVRAVEWEVEQSVAPGITMREFVDHTGVVIRSQMDVGLATLYIVAADQQLAQAPFDAPEIMARTLIRPDRAIDQPRAVRAGVYRLTQGGAEPTTLPSAGAQSVTTNADGSVTVRVRADAPVPSPADNVTDTTYTEASSSLDHEDEAIRALAVRALEEVPADATPLERARAMEAFVDRFVSSKSLGVGFATASEVARTGEGDCSEHAMLLAALLRTQGIPSRVVSGVVYVDQFVGNREVFGYHMWTQALLPDEPDRLGDPEAVHRWVDLDAAVRPFGGTHIAMATSGLADGDVINSMVALVDLLGDLEVEVIETGASGGGRD